MMSVFKFILSLILFSAFYSCSNSKSVKNTLGNNSSTSSIKGPNEMQLQFEVDTVAEFPGGNAAMGKFIQRNLRYPPEAMIRGISGKVYVSLVVLKTGEITNIVVSKEANSALGFEAKRLVKSMPKWKPAKYKGEAVNSTFNLPISFHNFGVTNR